MKKKIFTRTAINELYNKKQHFIQNTKSVKKC